MKCVCVSNSALDNDSKIKNKMNGKMWLLHRIKAKQNLWVQ